MVRAPDEDWIGRERLNSKSADARTSFRDTSMEADMTETRSKPETEHAHEDCCGTKKAPPAAEQGQRREENRPKKPSGSGCCG